MSVEFDRGEDLRSQTARGGYLSTFRGPAFSLASSTSSSSPQRGGLASTLPSTHHPTHTNTYSPHPHHHNSSSSVNNSSCSLNSPYTPASPPRSYLQAQGGGSGYNRNISFSDDSVTANTTVDCRGDSKKSSSTSSPPQQERHQKRQGKEENKTSSSTTSPRGILSKDGGSSRYGRIVGGGGGGSRSKPSQQSCNSGGGSSAVNRPLLYGGGRQPPNGSQQHRQSPPLPIPPDMSPLENRSGDDFYGVRGKVVSFSLAGDSYQLTPRRAGSSSRMPEAVSTPPQQSSGVEEVGGGGGHLYANQTGGSSLGHPYSLVDMADVLNDSRGAAHVGSRGRREEEDDDDDEDRTTTTTSGSYTINADDLCNEIDHLFFNDAVV
ncbi:hypothetical protein ACOMHN_059388 [Nucella lapillus]